jgi:hypothetical protein
MSWRRNRAAFELKVDPTKNARVALMISFSDRDISAIGIGLAAFAHGGFLSSSSAPALAETSSDLPLEGEGRRAKRGGLG